MTQWAANLITMVVGVVTILGAIYSLWNQNAQFAAQNAERFARLEEQTKNLGNNFDYRFTAIEERLLRLENRK
jgi:hypothetical protein